MATQIDVVVFKCHKIFSDVKSVKWCVIYRTKNSAPSQTVASARASPQHLAHSFPDLIQIGSISAKL